MAEPAWQTTRPACRPTGRLKVRGLRSTRRRSTWYACIAPFEFLLAAVATPSALFPYEVDRNLSAVFSPETTRRPSGAVRGFHLGIRPICPGGTTCGAGLAAR